ncbi:hypothetical protein OSTOST_08638 [Ostertagia ostertagi]
MRLKMKTVKHTLQACHPNSEKRYGSEGGSSLSCGLLKKVTRWPTRFEEQARMMTRDAKRGGTGENTMIDDDMLPPTDSDEYESNGEESTDGGEGDISDGDSDDNGPDTNLHQYNPNRDKAPTSI